MVQFRWATVAMTGNWCNTRDRALRDALAAGHAELAGDNIVLRDFAWIEYGDPSNPQQIMAE